VHQAGLPLAADHPLLQEAIDQHACAAAPSGVPADLGFEARTMRNLRAVRAANAANDTSISKVIPSGLINDPWSCRGPSGTGDMRLSQQHRQCTIRFPQGVGRGCQEIRYMQRDAMEFDVCHRGAGRLASPPRSG